MKTTDHFWQQRLRYPERARIPLGKIQAILERLLRRELQEDGRVRCWGIAPEVGGRHVRVANLG